MYVHPGGPGVRVDDGFEQGMDIPIYYDPMLAKLIVWAATREQAMNKMLRVIGEYEVAGVATTLPFGSFVMQHPAFRSGQYDTNFVAKYFKDSLPASNISESQLAALLALYHLEHEMKGNSKSKNPGAEASSQWKKCGRRNDRPILSFSLCAFDTLFSQSSICDSLY